MADFKLDCVLFDLDGTLVDTAPDLIASLNKTLVAFGFSAVAAASVKPYISYGALAMIQHAAAVADEAISQQMLAYMLDTYQHNVAEHSRFFDGIGDTLETIEASGLKWGVITNKKTRFTMPLMDALQLTSRAACIICGDTTANSKPHPEPMFAGCQQAGVLAENCVYIGDALHDITAGKSAGMKTLVALYGYLKIDDQPLSWDADALIEHPQHLTQWIQNFL